MASSNKVASPGQMEAAVAAAKNKTPGSTEYQLRKYLMLLSTLVATVTYAAGLNLPGGAWQEDAPNRSHLAGDSMLQYAHHKRYLAFYYFNATAFAASLVVSLLLLVLDGKNTGWERLLRVVMVLDLLGLMGAYAAGSCRDLFTTIYSALLVSGVFAYIVIAFSAYLVSMYRGHSRSRKQDADNADEGADGEREELHEVLMLLATFAVTITYVAGLNPPGGFWDDSDPDKMSDPILQEKYPSRYQAFYVCNSTAFVASLLIIILLVDKKLSTSNISTSVRVRFVALHALIITALLGLMGAYAAGSCREVDDTTYVVCLIGAVLAYIFLQVALTKAVEMKEHNGCFKMLATIYDLAAECLQAIRKFFAEPQPQDDQTIGDQVSSSSSRNNTQALEKARSLVLLLATLVVSITYQAGMDPPGGLWPDDSDKNGKPILLTTDPTRYKVFYYSNSAAFVASLIVIIMVQSRFLLKGPMLQAAMILDLFGLISAYAAGSCRDQITSIYVVALAGIVLVYVVIHIVFFTLDHRDNHRDAEKLENRREVLLLLAILAATLTYQAGLTPPGGFWPADNKDSGHRAGSPVLLDNYHQRYNAFFYCNAASFMASVATIVLLVNPNLYRPGIRCYALYVCMVVGMFGLMGAYAAGSSRSLRSSIYVLTVVVAVFAFVALEVGIFWVCPYLKQLIRKLRSHNHNSQNKSSDSEQAVHISEQRTTPPNHETDIKGRGTPGEKNIREYLMLLGVLAASVTYQTGFKPPGGLWQKRNNDHSAGNPILYSIKKHQYQAFFYSNSTSFMASIVVIILLLPATLHKHNLPLWSIHTAILLDMLGLLGAYAAGSTRDWETSMNVIYLVIPVLAYIAAYAAVSIFRKIRRFHKQKPAEQA